MDNQNARQKSPFKPFVMGLVLGALAGMLGMYLHQSSRPQPLPSAIKSTAQVECTPVPPQTAEPTVRPSKDPKDYEFYGVLEKLPVPPTRPDIEQPLPPPPSESPGPAASSAAPKPAPAPAAAENKYQYLQIASFKSPEDADGLKARIVLAGLPAFVVSMEIPEKGIYYRVRVGPFENLDALSKAREQLASGGIDLQNAFVGR